MPILKVWDKETQKYIGIPAIKGDKGENGEKGDIGPQGPQGEPGVSTKVNGIAPDETGNVTLTATDVGALAASGGDMTGAINMNGQSISGLNDPTEETQAARKGYVDASVRKAAPRNLLDNSDFRNPVNQRGITSETDILGYAYFIDRWSNASDTTTKYGLSNQGVTIGSTGVRQTIEGIEAGTVLTAAIKYGGNIICVTGTIEYTGTSYKSIASYNDGTAKVFIFTQGGYAGIMLRASDSNSSITVEWAALYEGSYTAETLPEYHPKGYGAELTECQRYFMRYGGSYAFIAVGNVETASLAQCLIQLPVLMRLPTASVNITADLSKFRIKNGTASVAISDIKIYHKGRIVSLACTISSNFTPGGSCLLTTVAGDNFIELSADL